MARIPLITDGLYASHLSFTPIGTSGICSLKTDGSPAKQFEVMEIGGESLQWRVKQDPDERTSLVTGKTLRDIEGWVNVTIGKGSAVGEAEYGDKTLRRGVLHYGEESTGAEFAQDEQYFITLHTSSQLYEQLKQQALSGRFPHVQISAVQPGMNLAMGGYETQWNNKEYPFVPIVWFEFKYVIGDDDELNEEDLEKQRMRLPLTKGDFESGLQKAMQLGMQIRTGIWLIVGGLVLLAYLIR